MALKRKHTNITMSLKLYCWSQEVVTVCCEKQWHYWTMCDGYFHMPSWLASIYSMSDQTAFGTHGTGSTACRWQLPHSGCSWAIALPRSLVLENSCKQTISCIIIMNKITDFKGPCGLSCKRNGHNGQYALFAGKKQ